jgi:aerobic carbon-monoxide dehydrogenase large subunit
LQDYCLPRADNLSSHEVLSHATFCEHNPLKAKGCAEVGTVGIPPAIVNALLDALRAEGVTDIDMPAMPLGVWKAIRQARDEALSFLVCMDPRM